MPAFTRATERHLATVDHRLAAVVREAIRRAPLRIVVTEGRRSPETHAELMRLAGTRSPRSPHTEGLGVRLSVIVGRRPRAELALMFRVAEAMRDAANTLGTEVRWCWCWRLLSALSGTIDYRAVPASDWPDAAAYVLG